MWSSGVESAGMDGSLELVRAVDGLLVLWRLVLLPVLVALAVGTVLMLFVGAVRRG